MRGTKMNQQQSHAAAVDPQALGQHYNLGNFRKEYSRSGWGCLIPLVLLVSIWVYSTAVGLASTINAFTLLVGVILLLLLIVSIYRRIKKGNLNAYLYE